MEHIKILFLCAIPVEFDAIRSVCSDVAEVLVEHMVCYTGTVSRGSSSWPVAIADVGAGNLAAALGTREAISYFQPDLALFVGVAGGVKDVQLGDVVIASFVYPYESGKDEETLRTRPRVSQLPHRLTEIAKATSRDYYTADDFSVYVGPIAAGEKVVASSASSAAAIIKQAYGDALAVEMEGAGFASAAERFDGQNFGLIRGISDLLDGKSAADSEGWQQTAAARAVEIAIRYAERFFLYRAGQQPEPDGPAVPAVRGALSTSSRSEVALSTARSDVVELRRALGSVTPSNTYILLATDENQCSRICLDKIPFRLVIDLNPNSDIDGLLANVRDSFAGKQVVRTVTPIDVNVPFEGLTWLFVRGLTHGDMPTSDSLAAWLRQWRRKFNTMLESLNSILGGRHVTVIVPVGHAQNVKWWSPILEDVLSVFGENVSVVEISTQSESDTVPFADFRLSLPTARLAAALDEWIPRADSYAEADKYQLPGADGDVEIQGADRVWLSEHLEIVWLGSGSGVDVETAELSFLQGGDADWAVFRADCDVTRDSQFGLARQLQHFLAERDTARVNLFHEPGVGGTVLARRIAFDTHGQYPTAILRRFRSGESVRRIDWIVRLCGRAILLVIDSVEITERMVGELVNELKAASVPAGLLHVSRRFGQPSGHSSSTYLPATLSDLEADSFFDTYSRRVPDAVGRLSAINALADDRRNPFFFALAAFEESFTGIDRYVSHRVQNLSDPQRVFLIFCAIADYYGQSSIPEHRLSTLFDLPASRAASVQSILSPGVRSLVWRSRDATWRVVHPLVARELLIQLGGGEDSWARRLTDWGKEFANFCRGDQDPPSAEMESLAHSVFLFRGNDELLGSVSSGRNSFSRFVEDVPSAEGAVNLLVHLAGLFSDEPHFAAHVARFYAFRMRNFERAEHFADLAVQSDSASAVLHHVRGMVYRAEVFDMLTPTANLDDVIAKANRASEAFLQSRSRSQGSNEHAFISEVQMRVRIISHAIRAQKTIANYLKASPHPYVVTSISVCEELLAALRYSGDTRDPSNWEQRSRAELTNLYGDYNQALQMFDSLLTRMPDVVPVRRQIVWTYLARANRDWRKIPEKNVVRIVQLLEENLRDAKYSASDIRQWWQAVRYLNNPPSQDRVFELLTYWRESAPTLDAFYCSYVAHAVDVLGGIGSALPTMLKFQSESAILARGHGHRTWSYDWVGSGEAMRMLVHQSELGEWDIDSGFWSDVSRLRRVSGRIAEIRGPHAGTVKIEGIPAFFVPSRGGFERGRDENSLVTGYLGFSYDGPRLWDPVRAG